MPRRLFCGHDIAWRDPEQLSFDGKGALTASSTHIAASRPPLTGADRRLRRRQGGLVLFAPMPALSTRMALPFPYTLADECLPSRYNCRRHCRRQRYRDDRVCRRRSYRDCRRAAPADGRACRSTRQLLSPPDGGVAWPSPAATAPSGSARSARCWANFVPLDGRLWFSPDPGR